MPEKDKLFLLFLKREKNCLYNAFWSRFCISRQFLKFPTACRAGKDGKSCAEGALEAVPGRKRYHFLRGRGYRPPAEQKNTQIPAQKVPR